MLLYIFVDDSVVFYCTMQYITVHGGILLYRFIYGGTMGHITVLCSILLYSVVGYCTMWYVTVLCGM